MCPNLKSPQKHQFPQLQTRLSFDQTLPQFITRWSLHQREGEGTRTGTLSLICVNLSCCLDTLAQDWTRYTTCLTTRSCSVQPNLPLLCHLGRLHLDCPSTPSPLFFDQVYFNVSMLYDIANTMLNYWPNTPLQRHRIILMEDVQFLYTISGSRYGVTSYDTTTNRYLKIMYAPHCRKSVPTVAVCQVYLVAVLYSVI